MVRGLGGVHASFASHLLDLLGAGAEPRPVYVSNRYQRPNFRFNLR